MIGRLSKNQMIKSVINNLLLFPKFNFAGGKITEFSPKIQERVASNAPICPSVCVQPTIEHQEFRQQNRVKSKRCEANLLNEWMRSPCNRLYTEKEAIAEAVRCFKCADSPCQKACSTGIDIRMFIHQIQSRNYYGAAKTILSDNPLGLSCGALCPVSELCASACNAYWLEGGTINISRLQEFACKVFKEMRVKQIKSPSLPKTLPESYQTKIAIIGCGPASISCATFLARLGYSNVQVYEKKEFLGGLVANEIPPNRTNWEDLQWEISLMTDLGVKVHYNKEFGKDITYESLKKEGYEKIFFGVGYDKPMTPLGTSIYLYPNVYNSKNFLPVVCQNLKKGMTSPVTDKLWKLKGHVIVLGIGDTALDCARSAIRLGADRVTVMFRRGFNDLRANDEIFEPALREKINFVPYSLPKGPIVENGKFVGMEFYQNEPVGDGKYAANKKEIHRIKCDYLITAFGSENGNNAVKELLMHPKTGRPDFNKGTYQHNTYKDIYLGGDISGVENLVDAINDGKVASWSIHKSIQEKSGIKVSDIPQLPGFFSEIDSVDISVTMAGKKFENPYGLASAPPSTSYPMIKRAFEQGWSFAVIKTFTNDKHLVTNISPRIFKATTSPLQKEPSYANIELITEKRARYWVEGAKEIKKQFPEKILVGSIMAPPVKEDWEELTLLANEAGFDLLELNLSCNHGMPDKGMGKALSDNAEVAAKVVKWTLAKAKMPVFAKLSPNSSINQAIAVKLKEAGVHGLTTTNTMSSFMDPTGDGLPYPNVGKEGKVNFGGAAGAVIRPISLRVASELSQLKLGLDMMASGGIGTGEHALWYNLYGGCAVSQVCSAVQEMDVTIIRDLTTGLKALLYLRDRTDLIKKGWKGQSPPAYLMQTLKGYRNTFDLWDKSEVPREIDIKKLPKLNDLVGSEQKRFLGITKMDADAQKFPYIDNDLCINCGKCFLTCMDSGYQAIQFDPKTHKPEVSTDCTGCGLCFAVCPVPGALTYKDRLYPYKPVRGDDYFEPKI